MKLEVAAHKMAAS